MDGRTLGLLIAAVLFARKTATTMPTINKKRPPAINAQPQNGIDTKKFFALDVADFAVVSKLMMYGLYINGEIYG